MLLKCIICLNMNIEYDITTSFVDKLLFYKSKYMLI